jgi:hypothetical protein
MPLMHLHSLKDSNASPKMKTTKEKIGTFPSSQHFGGRRACWRFRMRIRTNDKWVNYSHILAQTEQQVG